MYSNPRARLSRSREAVWRRRRRPTLAHGSNVVVDQKLADTQRWGTIDLHVDPWALIYLDGCQIGEAPVKGLQLPVGRRRLKLVNPVKHTHDTVTVDVPAKHPFRGLHGAWVFAGLIAVVALLHYMTRLPEAAVF